MNNPNSLSGGKNAASATTTDSDANHNSGPYFDVAASKNVSTHMLNFPHSGSYKIILDWNFRKYLTLIFKTQVTALLGKTAYLNCRVKNLGNKTVSI